MVLEIHRRGRGIAGSVTPREALWMAVDRSGNEALLAFPNGIVV